jgi:hypothetical protein
MAAAFSAAGPTAGVSELSQSTLDHGLRLPEQASRDLPIHSRSSPGPFLKGTNSDKLGASQEDLNQPPDLVDEGNTRRDRTGMDILILFLLLFTALGIWRGAPRALLLTCWLGALGMMLGLFDYHVSTSLGLSF